MTTTISNLLSSGVYGYSAPSAAVTQPATGASSTTDAAATSVASTAGTFTASGAASSPLTYNAAGKLAASQAAHVTPQAARAAVAAAQDAVTQAMGSLMSGSSSTTSTTDIFGASTNPSDPFGLSNAASPNPALSTSTPTTGNALTAQNAYLATQNVVTQSLKSLTA